MIRGARRKLTDKAESKAYGGHGLPVEPSEYLGLGAAAATLAGVAAGFYAVTCTRESVLRSDPCFVVVEKDGAADWLYAASTVTHQPLPVAFPELDQAVERLAAEERPAPATISRARTWLSTLRNVLAHDGLPWVAPHIATSPSGEVVLEWWKGTRTLTVYVDGSGAEFVRSWGRSVTSEMDDGTIGTHDEIRQAWRWLQTQT